ncbi:uncharacterized protein LOC116428044 isoform X2 [Nomia melanderi]|uniref:uncharacterized protein LOC116428044 isoform X2 n=1 Tax=Nomia melanderi TaxID=2448451 RepID=UPI0013044F32|nr:targeting protein for Xklp2-like isoform X2 [Nomia melanderi]
MLSPITNKNRETSDTPLTYSKNYLKPPSRKLWQKKNLKNEKFLDPRIAEEETWDRIDSPQFVDFSDLPSRGDSFFNKTRVIVSTPKPNSKYEDSVNPYDDNTMIESLKNFSLSGIYNVSPRKENIAKTGREETEEVSELNDTVIKVVTTKPEVRNEGKHPREKREQENKTERLKKTQTSRKMIQPWKKQPFVPCLRRKDPIKPKDPPLQTMIRAEQRKRFDATLKEREMQREERKRMQMAAKKMEEEKQIALLRKQIVHKAQPIRKYRMGLPEVTKRPLTNPVSPLTLKRRRMGTENVM